LPFKSPSLKIQVYRICGYRNDESQKFDKDKLVDTDIPSELNNQAQEIRNALIEAVAETSEELMEKFFDGQEFTDEEISKGIRQGIKDGSLVPVFCGSAALNFE